jgi:hypothetical protein
MMDVALLSSVNRPVPVLLHYSLKLHHRGRFRPSLVVKLDSLTVSFSCYYLGFLSVFQLAQ